MSNWFWLFLLVSYLGFVIAVIYTLREHRKMLATLSKYIQAHHEVLIKGENK